MIIFDQVELRILSGGVALSSAAFGEFALAFNKRALWPGIWWCWRQLSKGNHTMACHPINTINFWSDNGISGGKG